MRLARDINKLAAYGHARIGPTASAVEPRDQLSAARAIESMIQSQDVLPALSKSGETEKLLTTLPMLRRLGVPVVSLTGRHGAMLAGEADANMGNT